MQRVTPVVLIGLVLVVAGALALSSGGAAQAVGPTAPLVTPWPTWTPIPTPASSAAIKGAALDAPLIAMGDAKTGQFPFETCVDSWCEEYYNDYFQGGPAGPMVNARRSRELDYYWGLDRPMDNVNREGWSARFRRRMRITTPGIYRFYIYHDDGVKVLINNVSIFGDSLWGDIGPNVPSFNFFRQEVLGNQDLDIEIQFFDHIGSAYLKFYWQFEPSCQIDAQSPDCQRFPNYFTGWRGEYYNSPNYARIWPANVEPVWPDSVSNNLVVVRDDRPSGPDFPGEAGEGLYYDWGLGSPAGGITTDYLSARWTRGIQFPGGYYRFYLRTDDGARLIIDGVTYIDRWRPEGSPQAATTYTADIYLSPGNHTLQVEYQELVGSATLRLWWDLR